jgi:hypothetical protein
MGIYGHGLDVLTPGLGPLGKPGGNVVKHFFRVRDRNIMMSLDQGVSEARSPEK